MTTPRVPNALVRNPHLQGVADHARKNPQRRFPGWYDEHGTLAVPQPRL